MSQKVTKKPGTKKPGTKPRTPVTLPADDDALIRQDVVLGVYPIGATSLWSAIKAGTFPKPVKIGKRVNAWTVGSIRKKLAAAADNDAA